MKPYDLGYECGEINRYDNPYPYESIEYAQFDAGYNDARHDTVSQMLDVLNEEIF